MELIREKEKIKVVVVGGTEDERKNVSDRIKKRYATGIAYGNKMIDPNKQYGFPLEFIPNAEQWKDR